MSELLETVIEGAWQGALLLAVEFAGAFFGVQWAFKTNRQWESRKFKKRVTEIVPHIYLELCENGYLFRKYQSYDWFYRDSRRLKTAYWDIFRSELARWEEHDLVPLTRIYHNLTLINNHLNAGYDSPPRDYFTITNEIENLIEHVLGKYEDWFKEKPDAFGEFQKATIQYNVETYSNPHLRVILEQIKNRMEAKGLILT